MRKLLYILLISVSVSACGSSDDGSVLGVKYPPSAKDNITGVTYIDSNYISIPEGDKNSLYSLFYYAPADKYTPAYKEDGLPEFEFFIASSSIFGEQFRITPKVYEQAFPKDAHTAMLDRGYQLLNSDLIQNDKSSDLQARASGKSAVGSVFKDIIVENIDTGTINIIDALCVYESVHAYIYWQDTIPVTPSILADMKEYGDSFDKIYDTVRKYFGEESDTDGNGKVIILFAENLGPNIMGYFYAIDKYPKSSFENSNEADMFYLSVDFLDDKPQVLATLAHEFQHMTLFDTRYRIGGKYTNDPWLDEGLSMLSAYYTGYFDGSADPYISVFLNNNYAFTSLTSWSVYNYGHSSIYLHYLNDRFGSDIIKKIYNMGYSGVVAVERSAEMDFNDIFRDFAIALAFSGSGVTDDPKYNFKNIDIPAYFTDKPRPGLQPVDPIVGVNDRYSDRIPAYCIRWLQWDPKRADIDIRPVQQGLKFDGFILIN